MIWRLQYDNDQLMIMCSVLISYCVCRWSGWTQKTQPNDSSAVVWLSFWSSTIPRSKETDSVYFPSSVPKVRTELVRSTDEIWNSWYGNGTETESSGILGTGTGTGTGRKKNGSTGTEISTGNRRKVYQGPEIQHKFWSVEIIKIKARYKLYVL